VTTGNLLGLAVVGGLITFFASLGARALRQFSRHELGEICQRKEDSTRFSEIVRQHDRVALGTEMFTAFGAALMIAAGVIWVSERFVDRPQPAWLLMFVDVVALGALLAIIGVWIPWAIARLAGASVLYHTWPIWKAVSKLALPLVWGARVIDILLHRIVGRTPPSLDEESFEEEIRTIVTEGHREGFLEEEAREMIEGVIDLHDAYVSQIMTPRTDMHMVNLHLPWNELLADVIASGHTRIPVYDKNRDDIIGILYSKDLLPELAKDSEEPHRPLQKIIRKPLFVPETKAVDDLLQMFQHVRTHIAIVLDEYGGVSGLVTIEDVLEEIVGEIVDEYDQDAEQEIHVLDDKTCEALGRAHVDEINEKMGFELPEDDDFDTIGGFVFSELGRVPLVGESIVWHDTIRVTVLDATRRRVNRVRLERLAQNALDIA
jgi:CBS domain containing-hemolysin-like protein